MTSTSGDSMTTTSGVNAIKLFTVVIY